MGPAFLQCSVTVFCSCWCLTFISTLPHATVLDRKMPSAIFSCVLVALQITGKKPIQIGTYATVIGGGWGKVAACLC